MNIPNELILDQIPLGPINNFLYFIGDAKTKEVAIIDPAWDVNYLRDLAAKKGYKITNIFLTHGHPDHVNGVVEMLSHHDVPCYISKNELGVLIPRHKNIVKVEDHAKLKVGSIEFECLHTPGHSPGCHLFLYKNVLIAGDTVFIDGCGRCDLPGSNPKQMYNSLYNVIMKLPDETIIFPGHDYGPTPYATLASQKQTNPYLQAKSMEDFLYSRMGL